MSKNIVSGAIALVMAFVPMSASALSQPSPFTIPTIPQNASIQELMNFVVQLQAILQLLLSTSPNPPIVTDPISCPVYNIPICPTGSHVVGGGTLPNGCQAAPSCVPDASVAALSVSPMSGSAPLSVTLTASNLQSSGRYSIDYGNGTTALICNQSSSGVANCGSSWTGSYTYTNPGSYTIKLIKDPESGAGNCWGVDCAVVARAYVSVTGTTNTVTLSANSYYGIVPHTVTFYMNNVSPGTKLEFGDGTFETVNTALSVSCANNVGSISNCPQAFATHTYTQAGTYTARLKRAPLPTEANCTGSLECFQLAAVNITIDPQAQSNGSSITFGNLSPVYKMGDTMSVQVNYNGAPGDSNVCLVISSDTSTWEGGFQGFGGNDGCYWVTGTGSRTFTATLRSQSGFDFAPGRYHLVAKLIKATTGNFPPYAVAYSPSFNVEVSAPTSNPTLTYVNANNGGATANYANMPANTQVVLINQTSGARIESVSTMIANGGTGTMTMPFPPTVPSGTYYLKAQNYTTGAYIAQTVSFYIAGTTLADNAPSCTVRYSPNPITKQLGNVLNISWTSQNAVSRTYIVYNSSGSIQIGPLGSTLNGSQTDSVGFLLLPAGTYRRIDTVTSSSGATATCSDYLDISNPVGISCPVYSIPICAAGQHVVSGGTNANGCQAAPYCVADTTVVPAAAKGMCTYSAIKRTDSGGTLTIGIPSTITIDGGQAACSAWCSSQAMEANVTYSCSYNNDKITMIKREAQVASVLTAMQDVVSRIISWFKPSAAPAPQPVATTSTTQTARTAPVAQKPTTTQPSVPSGYPYYQPGATNAQAQGTVPTTPSKPAPLPGATAPATPNAPAPQPTTTGPDNMLRATFKGTALPPVPAATKQIAQVLCRADATCVWNKETITAASAFGKPGDPTITFVMPEPGKGQTLSVGTGFTFEFKDGSLPAGTVAANTYRVYLATYSAPGSPDKIYQASVGGVERTASGAVQIAWLSRIENADGSTAPIPPGTYYAGVVNIKNGLKGGSTGALTIK